MDLAITRGETAKVKMLARSGNFAVSNACTEKLGKLISAVSTGESSVSVCAKFFEVENEGELGKATLPILALLRFASRSPAADEQKILDALRAEYSWLRRESRLQPFLLPAVFAVLLEIVRICLRGKNPLSVDPLLATAPPLTTGPKSILVPLLFSWGRHALFEDRLPDAREKLLDALRLCLPSHGRQRRLILRLLVPVRLLEGILPQRGALKGSGLSDWEKLIVAMVSGNLRKFTPLAESLAKRNIENSLIFGPLEIVTFRNLLRKIWVIADKPRQLPISLILAGLQVSQGCKVSDEEAIDLCGNLISLDLISAYLSYEEKLLVMAGPAPFPRPPWTLEGFFRV